MVYMLEYHCQHMVTVQMIAHIPADVPTYYSDHLDDTVVYMLVYNCQHWLHHRSYVSAVHGALIVVA
jgi:hypothetical protein